MSSKIVSPSLVVPVAPAIVRATSLERDPLKRDFKNFQWRMWKTLFDNAPTNTMYELGDRLQHGPDRDIELGFRGLSKSYVTVGYAIWSLERDREEQVLALSGSGGGAKGNALLAWAMINTFDWLVHLRPSASQPQSSQAFDVAGATPKKSESFAALSLYGQVTGRRASLIIPDDVETPNTSASEGDRQELRRRYAELGGAVLIPERGRVKVLGTPQCEDSLYIELAVQRGYSMWICPSYYPTPEELGLRPNAEGKVINRYRGWVAPHLLKALEVNPELAGTPTEPTRFPEAELYKRKLEYGSIEFDRQFRLYLDAGGDQGRALKLRDLIVMEIPKPSASSPDVKVPDDLSWSPAPNLRWEDIPTDALDGDALFAPARVGVWQLPELKVLVVDPSGQGTDETSWNVLAQHLGRVFLLDADARLEGFSRPTMLAIAKDAKLWGVHKVIIEKNYGGGMFGELLRPVLLEVGHPCEIEELNAGQVQKEVRIVDTLEGLVTDHRLVVSAEVLRKDYKVRYPEVEEAKWRYYRLTYQFTRITKKRGALAHDDRVDSLASGVATFMGTLRRQLQDALRDSQEEFLKAQAERIMATRKKQGLKVLDLYGHPVEPDRYRLGKLLRETAEGVLGSTYFKGRRAAR